MFWAAVWLAVVLIAIKAYYLGIPAPLAVADIGNYLRSLQCFAVLCCLSVLAALLARRPATVDLSTITG